jgi:AraC-like DNA-binding protein
MPCYHVKSFDQYFYTLTKEPSITNITKANVTLDWQADTHFHTCTEIHFIAHGQGYIVLDNKSHLMQKGDLVIINPNIIHYEKYQKDIFKGIPLCFYCCIVDDFKMDMMPTNCLLPADFPPVLKTGNMENKFLSAFTETFEQHMAGEKWYAEICNNLCRKIVMLTLRLLHEKHDLGFQWQNDRNAEQIKRYIDTHFTENINTESIAKELSISRYTLYRIFRESSDSLTRYINKKRIDLAKQLIIHSSESLQEIACRAGYNDYSYFFTVFREITRISPSDYRRQLSAAPGGFPG